MKGGRAGRQRMGLCQLRQKNRNLTFNGTELATGQVSSSCVEHHRKTLKRHKQNGPFYCVLIQFFIVITVTFQYFPLTANMPGSVSTHSLLSRVLSIFYQDNSIQPTSQQYGGCLKVTWSLSFGVWKLRTCLKASTTTKSSKILLNWQHERVYCIILGFIKV